MLQYYPIMRGSMHLSCKPCIKTISFSWGSDLRLVRGVTIEMETMFIFNNVKYQIIT